MNLLTELNKSRTLKWGDPDSTEDDDAVVYLCALAADEITRLTADLKTAMNERDAYLDGLTDLRAELARWKAAIEGLTPQGSEYVDDPERCAEAIRERCRYPKQVIGLRAENAALWELLSNIRIEIDSAEAENAALREYREEDAATIVNMAHEIMDLREDRERLDWLQERIFVVNYVRLDRVAGGLMVTENYGRSERDVEFNGDTLRAALDAAIIETEQLRKS